MTARHVLIVGNGRDLPAHVHRVDPSARTSMLVRTGVLKRVREVDLHDRVIGVPVSDLRGWLDMARAVHAVAPVTHVASFSEKDQDKAAAVAGELGLRMHSPATVRAVNDKLEMRRRLAGAGLDGVAAAAVDTAADVHDFARLHGYPVVLKPVAGAGSSGVTVVRRAADVEQAWAWGKSAAEPDTDDLMVETFLDGPEVSVEAFSHRGEHFLVALVGKSKDPEHCVELGHMIGAEPSAAGRADIYAVVRRALDALGVQDGPTHTELVLTAEGPQVVETHLRPAGDDIPEMIRDTYGVDLLDLLVRQTLGEDVVPALRTAVAQEGARTRHPAIWFGVSRTAGTVGSLEGVEAARTSPGVVSVELEVDVGDEVSGTLRDSRDRLFAVRAEADDPRTALDLARRAADLIDVVVRQDEHEVNTTERDAMTENENSATSGYELAGMHHVQLAIPPGGEDLARRYYGEILGMTELQKPPVLAARGGCWFRRDGLEVHLGVEKDFRAAAKAHPGILVRDLDGLAKRLESEGVDVEWDDNFPGHRRFYSHDLHGNRLELLEPAGD